MKIASYENKRGKNQQIHANGLFLFQRKQHEELIHKDGEPYVSATNDSIIIS